MANSLQEVRISGLSYFPVIETTADAYKSVYDRNCDRIYSLAFWMTDNELEAELLVSSTFLRAFAMSEQPGDEMIDRALLTELRQTTAIGTLTLRCEAAVEVQNIRTNTKRVHLERAIVQLPATERMVFCMHDGEGYSHQRIARLLGITPVESQEAAHQARLRIRELVSKMN